MVPSSQRAPCEAISRGTQVDAETAAALGFDVVELERRALRAVELPMRWKTSRALVAWAGEPATGYEEYTRIRAELTSTGVFRHVRPDPALCDGSICRIAGTEIEQASCGDRLELGVTAEIETEDGALRATTAGIAAQQRPPAGDPTFDPAIGFMFTTQTDLAGVTGELVLRPRPNALGYRGTLRFSGWLLPDGWKGELSPSVMAYDSEASGTQYAPLYGSFPPAADPDPSSGDAGLSR